MEEKTKQKILVVEDEATLQKTLQEVLTAENYEVFSALDGQRGFEIAKEEIPDLILLDIILPKMDGFEVLAAIKAEEKTESVPVIILTNLGGIDDIQKALDLGATTYIVKADFSLEDVLRKIKETLENNR